jgi:exonuclease VII small subunit
LSILFRAYAITIERAFERLCRTVESELVFAAPQAATLEMNRTMIAQLAELRDLNGAAFGERLAVAVAPPLQLAMTEAVQPLMQLLAEAVGTLDDQSRSGVEDLLKRFLESVRGSAGTELRELSEGLKTLQSTLDRTHQSLAGSGADFSNRMSETAERLNHLIVQAGSAIGASADTSTATLAQMVGAMQMMFERANGKIEDDLAGAASGASSRIEAAMGLVLARLEAQIVALQGSLGGFQAGMGEQLVEARRRSLEAQQQTLAMIDQSTQAAAGVLQTGFTGVIREINTEVDRMVQSMRVAEVAMVAQASAVKDATMQSKTVADAFGRTADLVRTAAGPLVQSSERIAGASDRMAETISRSVTALEESQRAAKRLSDNLTGHIDRLTTVWTNYEARFGQVDADLGLALSRLSEETRRQLDILASHTIAIDKGLALAVDKLSGHVAGIAEGAGDLAESVEILRSSLIARAAE